MRIAKGVLKPSAGSDSCSFRRSVVMVVRMPYNREQRVMMSGSQGAAPKLKQPADKNQPAPVFEDEILDWDCALEVPPPSQRSGRIEVILRKLETEPSPA